MRAGGSQGIDTTGRQQSSLLARVAVAVLLTILVAGCSESPPRPFVDVFKDVLETGDNVIRIGRESGDTYETLSTTQNGFVSEDGGLTWRHGSWDPKPIGDQQREVCLTDSPSTCVRFGDDELAVQESNDGGQTWATVWSVDPSEGWLIGAHGNTNDRVVVEGFDLLLSSDDTVVAAVGELPPLHRSADGVWSPSIADVRHVSPTLLAGIIGATVALALALSLTRLSDRRYRFVQLGVVAALAALPLLLTATSLAFSIGDASWVMAVAAVLSLLPMTYAVALLLVAIIDLTQVRSLAAMLPSLVAAGASGTAMLAIYWLWSFDVVGYRALLGGWALVAVAGIAGAFAFGGATLPAPRFDPGGPGVVRALAEGTAVMLVLYLVPLRGFLPVLWLVIPLAACAVMFLRLVRRGNLAGAAPSPDGEPLIIDQ